MLYVIRLLFLLLLLICIATNLRAQNIGKDISWQPIDSVYTATQSGALEGYIFVYVANAGNSFHEFKAKNLLGDDGVAEYLNSKFTPVLFDAGSKDALVLGDKSYAYDSVANRHGFLKWLAPQEDSYLFFAVLDSTFKPLEILEHTTNGNWLIERMDYYSKGYHAKGVSRRDYRFGKTNE